MADSSKGFLAYVSIPVVFSFLLVLFLGCGILWGEKILVTRFTSLGVDINEVKLEVATKLFSG